MEEPKRLYFQPTDFNRKILSHCETLKQGIAILGSDAWSVFLFLFIFTAHFELFLAWNSTHLGFEPKYLVSNPHIQIIIYFCKKLCIWVEWAMGLLKITEKRVLVKHPDGGIKHIKKTTSILQNFWIFDLKSAVFRRHSFGFHSTRGSCI